MMCRTGQEKLKTGETYGWKDLLEFLIKVTPQTWSATSSCRAV